MSTPAIFSYWRRSEPHDPAKGVFNGYMVLFITNMAHEHHNHPPQVIYRGDNGHVWSLALDQWPGNLVPYDEEQTND
jgi:hypothetical protein